MALIDDEIKPEKKEENKIQELKCKNCNKALVENSPILLCENCFNEATKDTVRKIKDNLIKIHDQLKKINADLKQIEEERTKPYHIVVLNKLEIDFLNISGIKEKLLIDKKINEKAFILNQEQANKLRQIMKWSLFDIVSVEEEFKDLFNDN